MVRGQLRASASAVIKMAYYYYVTKKALVAPELFPFDAQHVWKVNTNLEPS
jgi:hypothetical protein